MTSQKLSLISLRKEEGEPEAGIGTSFSNLRITLDIPNLLGEGASVEDVRSGMESSGLLQIAQEAEEAMCLLIKKLPGYHAYTSERASLLRNLPFVS